MFEETKAMKVKSDKCVEVAIFDQGSEVGIGQ